MYDDVFDRKKFALRLGKQIAKVRKSKRYSQDRLCLEAGFSRGQLSRIESGETKPQPKPETKPVEPTPILLQVRGVDLSHHNKDVNFEEIKKAGYLFCFHKATEGLTFVDSKFKERREQMKKAGMIYGFYHFFRANKDPKKQAEHFLRTIGDDCGQLPPVLDWETLDGVDAKKHASIIQVFLDVIEKETGMTPIIYTGSYFGSEAKLPKHFANYPLWLAHYTTKEPRVPAPWTHYTFWQNSESGIVPGISGRCDTNFFNGTIEDLKAFGRAEVKLA